MRLGLFVLIGVLLPGTAARTQSAWPFALQWEHDGTLMSHFQLCVDGACAPLEAKRVGGETWSAPLPLLTEGEHRLVVQACSGTACADGRPELFVRAQGVSTGPAQSPVTPPGTKPKGASASRPDGNPR